MLGVGLLVGAVGCAVGVAVGVAIGLLSVSICLYIYVLNQSLIHMLTPPPLIDCSMPILVPTFVVTLRHTTIGKTMCLSVEVSLWSLFIFMFSYCIARCGRGD